MFLLRKRIIQKIDFKRKKSITLINKLNGRICSSRLFLPFEHSGIKCFTDKNTLFDFLMNRLKND